VKQAIRPRVRVKRLQFDRAIRITARLMLRNSGYYTIEPEVVKDLLLELAELVGVNAVLEDPSPPVVGNEEDGDEEGEQ